MSESILKKLHSAAKAIQYVEKRGENKHQKYMFVQAVDVVRQVREELFERGVIVVPGATGAEHHEFKSVKGGVSFLTTLTLHYRFVDTETGESIEIPWVGVGSDSGGDKGVYKAYTGGLKYALLSLFLIPTSDDPERDQLTVVEGKHPDDLRPAAPRIPHDRAKAILDRAFKVGLATLDLEAEAGSPPVLHAVLRAKLAHVGVDKIGLLDVDQAEEVERFLAEEAIPE